MSHRLSLSASDSASQEASLRYAGKADGVTRFCVSENGIYFVWEVEHDGDLRLLHFSPLPFQDMLSYEDRKELRLVELQVSGQSQQNHRGMKHQGTLPGGRLKYRTHRDYRTELGRKIEIVADDDGLVVINHMQFVDGVPFVRRWTEIQNKGQTAKGIEYVSSFCLNGIAKEGDEPWDEKCLLHIPHNSWSAEAQWCSHTLSELGLFHLNPCSSKRLSFSNTGTWSSSELLPMGCIEDTESRTCTFWQIEHNASWHWEVGDTTLGHLYLQCSGPTDRENQWWKCLQPGEVFTSVVVAVGAVKGSFEDAVGEATRYRRRVRRPADDNKKLPIIFNDYMNCLSGDPTTEKELPLIDAAAAVGAEYYCIDAGWYGEGDWWETVGEWLPSPERFPGGIKEVLSYIRSKGMIPGLWLEIEVVGINSPLAERAPDDWFFMRRGKRVISVGRYQLDFRNPDVVKHADGVVERLVNEYGVGYIKMDYNIDAGAGTELNADSLGDGLLEHNRAYVEWLSKLFERYPELTIENCGSGGMRMDYGLLNLHSIQSSSDQTDYRKTAVVAASCPTAVAPEQCAVWSYPLKGSPREEVVFNMVNALLMRIHMSGRLDQMSPENLALVREGLDYYKRMRADIPNGLPFWPLGLPQFRAPWLGMGLRCEQKAYLAVWRMDTEEEGCVFPLEWLQRQDASVCCAYPHRGECGTEWNNQTKCLRVSLPQRFCARILEITLHA